MYAHNYISSEEMDGKDIEYRYRSFVREILECLARAYEILAPVNSLLNDFQQIKRLSRTALDEKYLLATKEIFLLIPYLCIGADLNFLFNLYSPLSCRDIIVSY